MLPLGAVVAVLAYRAGPADRETITAVAGPAATPIVVAPPPEPSASSAPAPASAGDPVRPNEAASTTADPGRDRSPSGAPPVAAAPSDEAPAGGPDLPSATVGTRLVVVNSAPDGVRLRSAPGDGAIVGILGDGTPVTAAGASRRAEGVRWLLVRDGAGREGWVAEPYLAPVAPSPTATIAVTPTPATDARPTTPAPALVPPATATPPVPAIPPATRPPAPAAAPTTAPTVARTAAPTPRATTATPASRSATAAPAPTQSRPATGSAPSNGARGAAPLGADCPPTHPIKGNHSSSGEWIYHPPGGQFYGRTIPEDCFASEADARAAGYRRSLR